MSAKRSLDSLRTWIEIDAKAARKNYDIFRKLVGKNVKLWAVIKSNAYGHGLFAFSKLAVQFGIDGFCVDSLVEGIALRKSGIKKPILVLGPTLPSLFKEAAKHTIAITISNVEALKALLREKRYPEFHLKIDTGMHRQGFYPEDLKGAIALLERSTTGIKNSLKGIYTHFASAKNKNEMAYTEKQFKLFQTAATLFKEAGFKNLIKHAAATGGTLFGPKYHLDAVRVGIGFHGIWPSPELKNQLAKEIKLEPSLSWRAVVGEVKKLKKGERVGYDLSERVKHDTMMAILPVGYWHGFPRALSGKGGVIIKGKYGKVLGRVSMDLLAVEAPYGAKPGDIATLIGHNGRTIISADETAVIAGTTAYELLTRLNPLMERVIVQQQERKSKRRKR
jgi:alanine racemase